MTNTNHEHCGEIKELKNNLFNYATSELSQDAFICFLLSFAMKEFAHKDKALTSCAKELLGKMLETDNTNDLFVTDIRRQYKNIDVLVTVNNSTYIIIEDKTFGRQRGKQLNRYKEALLKANKDIKEDNVHCVYYKILEQDRPEPDVVNIDREYLLNLFSKHHSNNSIYKHYFDYLNYIEADATAYKHCKDMSIWRKYYNHIYPGFFTHLIKNNIISTDRSHGWNYANNANGGIWCLWWYVISREELESMNITKELAESVYLQMEGGPNADNPHDRCISIRFKNLDFKKSEIKDLRWQMHHFFEDVLRENGFSKKRFMPGVHMSVGHIKLDYKGHQEQIKIMESAMETFISKFKYDPS